MTTTTPPITTNSVTPNVGTASASGATGLTSNDFMNLMIQQLQNQDPLNPTDSNQLLQQISEISTLQSNQAMQTSLGGLTLQQSIGAGGNLIGKGVTGLDSSGNQFTGNVIGVSVQNQQVLLQLDSTTTLIPMANVTAITPAIASSSATSGTTTATTPSPTAVQNLMTALQGFGL